MKKIFWGLVFTISVTSFVSADVSTANINLETKKTNKIVGGIKSPQDAWPSTVALLDTDKIESIESGLTRYSFYEANYQAQFCGATLIASKWVLTAAHCVTDGDTGEQLTAASIKALLGTSDLSNGGVRHSIKRIIVHPSYNYISGDSDIALLELVYSSGVQTLPVSGDDAPVNLLAKAVGWGATSKKESDYPFELHEVEVPIVERSVCKAIYDNDFTQNMICAGYRQGGKDTCKSDSGGPLMGIQYGNYVQIGITSWGIGCAKPNYYAVYTRLSHFEQWINSYTGSTSNSGGGFESWSRFYSPDGGGIIFFVLLPLSSLLFLRRKRKGLS